MKSVKLQGTLVGTNGNKIPIPSISRLYSIYILRGFSAWQHGNIACSPPNDSNMKFDKIQELQEEETAKRER